MDPMNIEHECGPRPAGWWRRQVTDLTAGTPRDCAHWNGFRIHAIWCWLWAAPRIVDGRCDWAVCWCDCSVCRATRDALAPREPGAALLEVG